MNKRNLLIIGGGFAGATLAQRLERQLPPEWEIFLLSETNFVTYYPLLPEVVGASVLPGHVQAPLRQMMKRTRIRMVRVDRVDLDARRVFYHNDEPGELPFEQVVFAAGVRANTGIVEGMAAHALPLKTVGDALYIRNRIVERLEQATIHPDEARRRQLTTFVVIGGGFSGVETAGELDDFLQSAERYYKNVRREHCRVVLLHGGDCLLPELSESLGRKTEGLFRERGIEVHLNARAVKIEDECVLLDDGGSVAGATIISTIGTVPHRFIQDPSLPLERGKIRVEGDMSVAGHPGVWALGDCALVPNAYTDQLSPPTAQYAEQQARTLADNIGAGIHGGSTRVFSYRPKGYMASIGHNKAVAEIYGVGLSGFIAFLLWRGSYLLKVPTLARKVRLFLEWNWAMFFPPDIAHLGFKRTEPEEPAQD